MKRIMLKYVKKWFKLHKNGWDCYEMRTKAHKCGAKLARSDWGCSLLALRQ